MLQPFNSSISFNPPIEIKFFKSMILNKKTEHNPKVILLNKMWGKKTMGGLPPPKKGCSQKLTLQIAPPTIAGVKSTLSTVFQSRVVICSRLTISPSINTQWVGWVSICSIISSAQVGLNFPFHSRFLKTVKKCPISPVWLKQNIESRAEDQY